MSLLFSSGVKLNSENSEFKFPACIIFHSRFSFKKGYKSVNPLKDFQLSNIPLLDFLAFSQMLPRCFCFIFLSLYYSKKVLRSGFLQYFIVYCFKLFYYINDNEKRSQFLIFNMRKKEYERNGLKL